MRRLLILTALLSSSHAFAAPGAARPTAAVLPPRGTDLDANQIGLLIQDRAAGLLTVSSDYAVLHIKQILSMADREDLAQSRLADPDGAELAARHLGADRVAFATLSKGSTGWTLSIQADRVPLGKGSREQVHLPADLAQAVEQGGNAMAQAIARLDRIALSTDALPAGTRSAEAMAGYGKCYPVLVRQPIGIENPTALLDSELSLAALGCQAALDADPSFAEARAALALALAIRGDDTKAIQTLSKLDDTRRYLPFRALALFWVATRYVSGAAGTLVLRRAIERDPALLLLRGYLGEQLNALRDQPAALEAWNEYLRISPHSPFARAKVAYTLSKQGHTAEAVEMTAAALKTDPQSAALKVELGGRQIDAGQPQLAIDTLLPLVSAGGGGSEAVLRLGYAMLLAGQIDTADDILKQVLANSPAPTEWRVRCRARLDLAKIAHRRGQDEHAIELLRDALKEGYRPATLAREDPALAQLLDRADRERAGKPAAVDLNPHPREASPFWVDPTGDIQPDHPRPPPPQGIELLHFGAS